MHEAIRVQTEPFDLTTEVDALCAGRVDVGAVATFVGRVRDLNDAQVVHTMTLEHYPGMTEASLVAIAADAEQRWPLQGVRIVHRVGCLAPGDPVVLVVVTSSHRHAAFDACRYVMDRLKTEAPFWKKETTPDGSRWVESRASDDEAAARWR